LINHLPLSWPLREGSIGDRYEGPQVANRIYRTVSAGRRPDRDRQPLDHYVEAVLQRPVYQQVVTGPDLKRRLAEECFTELCSACFSRVRVLGAHEREPRGTAGENATVTKHGFESRARIKILV
jgi:hypothetical protein